MTLAGASNRPKEYSFSAGPAMLPDPVEKALLHALVDFDGKGRSLLQLNHRSERFNALMNSAQSKLRQLMKLDDDFEILFCGFGASLHFSAIPLNLLPENGIAIYEMSGYWSDRAADEAEHYGQIWRFQAPLNVSKEERAQGADIRDQMLGGDFPAYVHYCANETIDGIEWPEPPDHYYGGVPCPRVSDMSSNLLSRPFEIGGHGLVYASAQKNLGITGLSVVIVRKDLLGWARAQTPRLMNYQVIAEAASITNTSPVVPVFALEQTLIWIEQQGGLDTMDRLARQRSDLLYSFIDNSECFINEVPSTLRSRMNVPFALRDPVFTESFLLGAEQRGLLQLAGHRSRGGIRASLYNAMPLEGVVRLTEWMNEFEQEHG